MNYSFSSDHRTLSCSGNWTIANLHNLETQFKTATHFVRNLKTVDVQQIEKLDSAGALFLYEFIEQLAARGVPIKLEGFNKEQQEIFEFVALQSKKIKKKVSLPSMPNLFYAVGEWAVEKVQQLSRFLRFVGELAVTSYRSWREGRIFRTQSILSIIETAGFQAVPIVALMAFLIGLVLAYQLAVQLRVYGVDIYIVDVAGIAMLREFAPLITSIIIAGRTSTAFAALIGTMKVNEEVDALKTMGISPIERLVWPRILGLIIALPLLVVCADFFGVLGSMVMTKFSVNIGYHAFIERFRYAVQLKQYVLGLVKAPVFALIIAAVGCFQGFQVSMSAESVGQRTTRAAVQALFLIIIADAGFSVLFDQLGY